MPARTTDLVPLLAGEKLNGEVDFAGNIDEGDSITGSQATALWADDRADASAVLFGNVNHSGTKITYGLQHAEKGRTAIVIVLAEMNSGQVFGHRIEVKNL